MRKTLPPLASNDLLGASTSRLVVVTKHVQDATVVLSNVRDECAIRVRHWVVTLNYPYSVLQLSPNGMLSFNSLFAKYRQPDRFCDGNGSGFIGDISKFRF